MKENENTSTIINLQILCVFKEKKKKKILLNTKTFQNSHNMSDWSTVVAKGAKKKSVNNKKSSSSGGVGNQVQSQVLQLSTDPLILVLDTAAIIKGEFVFESVKNGVIFKQTKTMLCL